MIDHLAVYRLKVIVPKRAVARSSYWYHTGCVPHQLRSTSIVSLVIRGGENPRSELYVLADVTRNVRIYGTLYMRNIHHMYALRNLKVVQKIQTLEAY